MNQFLPSEFESTKDFYLRLSIAEKASHDDYKNFSEELNNRLRTGAERSPEMITSMKNLDTMIKKYAAPGPIELYRGTSSSDVDQFIRGDIYCDPGYLSTSYRSDSLSRFIDDAVLALKCKPGDFMAPMETNKKFGDSEYEFLLSRGMPFRVVERQMITEKLEIERYTGKFYSQSIKAMYYYIMESSG